MVVAGRASQADLEKMAAFVTQLDLTPRLSPVSAAGGMEALKRRIDTWREADYAIVAVSGDANGADFLLELGALLGIVGADRICFIVNGQAPLAPQFDGMARHPMDGSGLWHLLLARTMRQAGLEVDLNRAI